MRHKRQKANYAVEVRRLGPETQVETGVGSSEGVWHAEYEWRVLRDGTEVVAPGTMRGSEWDVTRHANYCLRKLEAAQWRAV